MTEWKRTSSASKSSAPYSNYLPPPASLHHQAKGVIVGPDDGGRIVDHAGRVGGDLEDTGLAECVWDQRKE